MISSSSRCRRPEHPAATGLVYAVVELFAGVREGDETDKLEEFVGLFPVIPVALEVAKTAGLHRRDFGPSHGTGLADGMLAATADLHALELKTLNTRHYHMERRLPGDAPRRGQAGRDRFRRNARLVTTVDVIRLSSAPMAMSMGTNAAGQLAMVMNSGPI